MDNILGDKEMQKQILQTVIENEREWRKYIFEMVNDTNNRVCETNEHLKTQNGRIGKVEERVTVLETIAKDEEKIKNDPENKPLTMTRVLVTAIPIFLGLNGILMFILTMVMNHVNKTGVTP